MAKWDEIRVKDNQVFFWRALQRINGRLKLIKCVGLPH